MHAQPPLKMTANCWPPEGAITSRIAPQLRDNNWPRMKDAARDASALDEHTFRLPCGVLPDFHRHVVRPSAQSFEAACLVATSRVSPWV
eukprot:COSAG03_NODE_798_length_5810_cov_4.253371_2_plen_89_part_00